MVKTLCIFPKVYNKCKVTHLTHLNKFHVDNDDDFNNDIKIFIDSDEINFSHITHLKLENDFDAFCYLLAKFANVTHLELEEIYSTEFNDKRIAALIQLYSATILLCMCTCVLIRNSKSTH